MKSADEVITVRVDYKKWKKYRFQLQGKLSARRTTSISYLHKPAMNAFCGWPNWNSWPTQSTRIDKCMVTVVHNFHSILFLTLFNLIAI